MVTSFRSRRAILTGAGTLALALPGCVSLTTIPAPTVRVVQLIPAEIPNEEWPNPEPSIAVNPANPLEIVASALVMGRDDPCQPVPEGVMDDSTALGLLRSTDGGKTWSLQCVLKISREDKSFAGDISLDFDLQQNLFASYLTYSLSWPFEARFIRATTATAPASWTIDDVAGGGTGVDMPWTSAAPGGAGYAFGVPTTPDAGTCMGGFVTWGSVFSAPSTTCISSRTSSGEDYTPHVKTAVHGDGTMYALAYRPISTLSAEAGIKADVVLRRQDPAGAPAFEALLDAPASSSPAATCGKRDGKAGLRLARCVLVPTLDDWDPDFGDERRVGSQVAVAVSPNNSKRVAIVYGDSAAGETSHMTLHVRVSDDGGASHLDTDILTVTDATNPALAFSASGRLGFSYQQLLGLEWHTTFVSFSSANEVETSTVLAKVPFSDPDPMTTANSIIPYIGEYMDLASTGEDFLGVFSAGGRVDLTRFPLGLTSFRTPPGTSVTWPDGTVRALLATIDPFFFRISPSCASVEVTPTSTTLAPGATIQLTAVAKDAYGNVLPSAVLTWASSAPMVAGVTNTGLVTAAAAGTTTIVMRCGEASGALTLTVVPTA